MKRIIVKVKTHQPRDSVKQNPESSDVLEISTRELPVKGKANQAVIQLLSKYLSVPKSNILIIKGVHSKTKIVEIAE